VITSFSEFSWEVYSAVLFVWIFVYFCVWKGANSSSYIVWITVPVPVIFIIVMIIKGLTLPGASLGLKMYLLLYSEDGRSFNFLERLGKMEMWAEATG